MASPVSEIEEKMTKASMSVPEVPMPMATASTSTSTSSGTGSCGSGSGSTSNPAASTTAGPAGGAPPVSAPSACAGCGGDSSFSSSKIPLGEDVVVHCGDSKDSVAPPAFEGPEKCLEVDFTPSKGPESGLRCLNKTQWDSILADARCEILCWTSNAHFDAYVLSESSLFVYPHTMVLKTCGTTTLLRCLPKLIEFSKEAGLEIEWVAYTRKDFLFPSAQLFPHSNPNEEVAYLKNFFDGDAFVLGPITGDHWFVFIADHCDRPSSESKDRTLDMMMFDIDPEVARMFHKNPDHKAHKDVTVEAGIDHILPGAFIQEYVFDPCGYSCNGLLYEAYFTIHVTPEEECSYASFETNIKQSSYSALIKHVLKIFKPKRFTMTLFADQEGNKEIREHPILPAFDLGGGVNYAMSARSHAEFGDYQSFLANYKRSGAPSPTSALAAARTRVGSV